MFAQTTRVRLVDIYIYIFLLIYLTYFLNVTSGSTVIILHAILVFRACAFVSCLRSTNFQILQYFRFLLSRNLKACHTSVKGRFKILKPFTFYRQHVYSPYGLCCCWCCWGNLLKNPARAALVGA